jgi:hypothetical protein
LVLVKNFLAKNNVKKLEHSAYSPDLAPADFLLFPRLKSTLKGRCFCDITDINKNMTEELKRLSQNGFQECFQHLYSRWQKCIVAHWDYTKGNVGQIVVLFCISQKRSDSRNVLKLSRMTVRKSLNNVSGGAENPGSSSPRLTDPCFNQAALLTHQQKRLEIICIET